MLIINYWLRHFFSYFKIGNFSLLLFLLIFVNKNYSQKNVVLIITDDQGYGDFGFTGNPLVHTPHLDELARQSIFATQYYVSPVCAPTRASLMTGRYSLRTGVRDTYNGGAIMDSAEVTIAELLRAEGYATGIFGKWHLGDTYPSRPIDQGFDEALVHLSGGMGQVGDVTTFFEGDSSYFNPVLWHNGVPEQYQGYCSDIFAEGAIAFIRQQGDQPFFCYLSFNAPHTPLQLPASYYEKYKDIDPSLLANESIEMTERDKEDARRVYGMVENIDDNLGKLMDELKRSGQWDNTVVLFMTDNGPQQLRYNSGLRGLKGTVYEGGIRVPLLMRLPNGKKGRKMESPIAHLDILPTIADLLGISLPDQLQLDGRSIVPLLEGVKDKWLDRPFLSYWTRRFPEKYQNISLHQGHFKLVGHTDYDAEVSDFELYDLSKDRGERNNIVGEHSGIAIDMKAQMDKLLPDLLESMRTEADPFIAIGSAHENPVWLNRNDASGERGIWAQDEIYGFWEVKAEKGCYELEIKMRSIPAESGSVLVEMGEQVFRKKVDFEGVDTVVLPPICLEAFEGPLLVQFWSGGRQVMPFWVRINYIED